MDNNYSFKDVEVKWQKKWKAKGFNMPLTSYYNKYYALTMFSYPSGDKLHIGHWYNYGPADTFARFKKMMGYSLFQPQGFDSFGLPAENYAISNNIHPAESTNSNIQTMKTQLDSIGAMYDWHNEIVTSSPEYYKWTQWLFLELYKRDLAYQKKAPVNWCPSCSTVLANEQVKEGHCDRCKEIVTKKELTQWFFKITDYAEELLVGLEDLDWPDKTKHMQRNWIGKSIGAKIYFNIKESKKSIEVFTTRQDTIFGVSFITLSPEHPFISSLINDDNKIQITSYIEEAKKKTEIERSSTDKDKSGVFTGFYAVNPMNNSEIPIWISDYVLASYGTGAVMGVPGSDERDFEFAKKYNLKIHQVVTKNGEIDNFETCYTEPGILVNSDKYSGLSTEEAKNKIADKLKKIDKGDKSVQYKLHDWLISRQRYWGTPIPIIHCPDCGSIPVSEDYLPLLLPDNIKLSSTYGNELSPLASCDEYINTSCPQCGADAKRDADTMDTFVCSSWYYLRYPNANYKDGPFDPEGLKLLPVDCYIGGSEHATMHLLYARFITKALRDGGYLGFDEPFTKLYHQGTITKDGSKMSKSRGNTVSPDEFIDKYGSDTFRAYLMFMGPFDEGGDWNDKGITGIDRFLKKIWRFCHLPENKDESDKKDLRILHKTIKYVSNDLNEMKFNTAISKLMELINHFSNHDSISKSIKLNLIKMIAPIVPHIAEELWEVLGSLGSVFDEEYPKHDPRLVEEDTARIAIQINGKLRGNIEVLKSLDEKDLIIEAKKQNNVNIHLIDKTIIREIIVPNRLINFVVK